MPIKSVIHFLEEKIKRIEHELLYELPKDIAAAAAQGDLSENAEYEAALDRRRLLQQEVMRSKTRLGEVSAFNESQIPKGRTGLGSIVKVLDLDRDEEFTYEIVLVEMSDTTQGKISIASPIAKGLLNKEEGDEITLTIPAGTRNFEILDVITYHERA